jgi:lysozyme
MMTPRVCDIYHGDVVGGSGPAIDGFKAAAAAGLWGVIHKASQGSAYKDVSYAARRQAALDAGLLWGAYHFNDGSSVATQIDNFFAAAQPDDTTLMVLDFEDWPRSQMSPQQMLQFLKMGENRLGRKLTIYSGNRLKETLGQLAPDERAYVREHRLWLCQYGPKAALPPGFSSYFLWQYTGDGAGQQPHGIAGITVPGGKGIDLNVYDGTQDQLKAEWAA